MGWRAAFIAVIATLASAPTAFAATFTVNGNGDGGTCTGSSCPSLRAAIAAAEATKTEADTITVPEGVINLGNELVVQSEMTIIGADARKTIIDGGAKYRLRTTAPAVLTLTRFTIRNGAAGGGDITDGGGIYNAGRLTLQDVRVTQSTAVRGGGIANNLGLVVADNLLVDNNVATGAGGGGGILNVAGQEFPEVKGWLILTDATIFKNTATGSGGVGGIFSTGTGASVSLSRSTLADNVGGTTRGVGGIVPSGNTQVVGSIVARNLVAGDIVNCDADRRPTDGNFNVEDDKDCGLAPGGMKPQLATALSDQGGQVDVLTIPTGSDAFNRMPFGDTPCEGTDARGLSRPQGTACDAGAFEIDQPATVTITEGPSGTITATSTQFNFQANESGVTVQCDLTGPGQTAGFEECYKSNAQPYSGLADGPYTFSVRAVSASFPNPTPTTRSFVVNAAGAPNTTITGGPTGLTSTTTPAFAFTSTEPGSTFQCALDSTAANAWASCTSPHTTAPLAQGAHTLFVRAIDAAGTVDASPASRAFTVDSLAPDTTITGGPIGLTNVAAPTFTFTSTEPSGGSFQCSLDGAAFTGCNSPHSPGTLSNAQHTYRVRAVDAAGNVDATPAERTFTIDAAAPAPPVIVAPTQNQWLTSNTVTVRGTAEAGTSVALMEGQFARGTTTATGGTWTITVLNVVDTTHTFTATARDAAGNTSGASTRTFSVDTVAPNAPVITDASVEGSTVSLAGTTEQFATIELFDGATSVGAADVSTTTWSRNLANVADGAHAYTARARDRAGNTSAASAVRQLVVDARPPSAEVTGGPAGPTTDTNPVFTFTASDPTTECRLDGPSGPGAFGTCTSPKAFSALAPGDYVFFVRTTDAVGNQSTTQRAFTVTQVQQAQPAPTPVPTVGAAQTPQPTPTPVPNQTIVVAPKPGGTVLVKAKGETKFAPLDVTKGIPNGSEVDVRNGRVTLTSIPRPGAPPESADFYGGMFIVTQRGGITDLKLSEPLTGCPKGGKASAAAGKKSRKLWGNGKGSFRTSGKYSAATVRGTIWLVQDNCTSTLTRVTQGVVSVKDFVTKKSRLLRKGQRYTARARR